MPESDRGIQWRHCGVVTLKHRQAYTGDRAKVAKVMVYAFPTKAERDKFRAELINELLEHGIPRSKAQKQIQVLPAGSAAVRAVRRWYGKPGRWRGGYLFRGRCIQRTIWMDRKLKRLFK